LLPDAFQIVVALAAGCEAFLTDDVALNRLTELRAVAIALIGKCLTSAAAITNRP